MEDLRMPVFLCLATIVTSYSLVIAQSHIPENFSAEENDLEGLREDDVGAPEMPEAKRATASAGSRQLDMCACCGSHHLSFCCSRCLKQGGFMHRTGGFDQGRSQATLNRLAVRLNTACMCCEKSADKDSRCCQVCKLVDDSKRAFFARR